MNLKIGSSLAVVFALSTKLLFSQSHIVDIGGPKLISLKGEMPDNLASERSVVLLSVPTLKGDFEKRGDWKVLANEAHKNFRKIGIDPVAYLYIDDLNAGPEVKKAYLELLDSRKVKNLILLHEKENAFQVVITPFTREDYIQSGQSGWMLESIDLYTLTLKMGRQVLRQNMDRNNFLVPEGPEFFDDLVLFTGTRYENYPTRIRRLPIAIQSFQTLTLPENGTQEIIKEVNEYNQQVARNNGLLISIMDTYPYEYQLVDKMDVRELFENGIQYALIPLSSTGLAVKKTLNYPTTDQETHHLSSTYKPDSTVYLKKIPVTANVTKFYIKQTVVGDLHVGEVWDADVRWDLALKNFIFNLKNTLIK